MELFTIVLRIAAILVGLLGLGVTVWLGLSLVALGPRRSGSWVAALLFWGFSLVFALNLLQLGRPLVPDQPWLPYDVLRWVLVPLPAIWVWLLPDILPVRLRPLLRRFRRLVISFTLLLAGVTTLLEPGALWLGLGPRALNWLFYPLYLLLVLLATMPTLSLARRGARLNAFPALRDASRALALATALVLLGALLRVGGLWIWTPFARESPNLIAFGLPGDLALLLAAVALGAALVLNRIAEGETNAPAFVYSLANAAGITVFYTLIVSAVTWLLGLSWLVLVIIVPLAVATHWLTDWSRSLFDTVFYRAPVQRLRADLRTLVQSLEQDEALEPQLRPMLARLAHQAGAPAIAVALAEPPDAPATMRWVASHPPLPEARPVEGILPRLQAAASLDLSPPVAVTAGSALGIPLLHQQQHLGMLIAWSGPTRGFSDLDRDLLLEAGSQLATLLTTQAAQRQRLEELNHLLAGYRQEEEALRTQTQELTKGSLELDELGEEARGWVEEAMRRLHDVAFLGQHPLARLALVKARLGQREESATTHLERGQIVRQLCEELIERLRPPGAAPREPYPPEWRLYTVVHAAYIEQVPNREIMSRLYIGEGTFHRARRQALTSLAEALIELERAARAAG